MSVLIKRSSSATSIPAECPYGCCTEVFGKNVKHVRRSAKRRDRREWKREAASEMK